MLRSINDAHSPLSEPFEDSIRTELSHVFVRWRRGRLPNRVLRRRARPIRPVPRACAGARVAPRRQRGGRCGVTRAVGGGGDDHQAVRTIMQMLLDLAIRPRRKRSIREARQGFCGWAGHFNLQEVTPIRRVLAPETARKRGLVSNGKNCHMTARSPKPISVEPETLPWTLARMVSEPHRAGFGVSIRVRKVNPRARQFFTSGPRSVTVFPRAFSRRRP